MHVVVRCVVSLIYVVLFFRFFFYLIVRSRSSQRGRLSFFFFPLAILSLSCTMSLFQAFFFFVSNEHTDSTSASLPASREVYGRVRGRPRSSVDVVDHASQVGHFVFQ